MGLGKDEIVDIIITNWEERQRVRKDVKDPHWFKLSTDFYRSMSLNSLSSQQKYCFCVLLAIASRRRCARLRFTTQWFKAETGLRKNLLLSCIEKLKKDGTITLPVNDDTSHPRYGHVTGTLPRRERREEKDCNTHKHQEFLKEYPNQIGVSSVVRELEKFSDSDIADLRVAIKNYLDYSANLEPQFIFKLSNFVLKGHWRDYIKPSDTHPTPKGIVCE